MNNNTQAQLANQLRLNAMRDAFEQASIGDALTMVWTEQISPSHRLMAGGKSDYSTALGARLAITEFNGSILTVDEIIGNDGYFNFVVNEVFATAGAALQETIQDFRHNLRNAPMDAKAVFNASLLLEVAKSRAVTRMLDGGGVFPEDMIADVGVNTKLSPMDNPVINAEKLITVPWFPDCSPAYRVLILKHLVSQCIEFAKTAQAIQAAAAKARA